MGRQGASRRSKAGFLLVTPSPPLLVSVSRITEPTEGCAEIHGRVGSLLEVDSGFNPELIGQENPGKGFICNLDKDS